MYARDSYLTAIQFLTNYEILLNGIAAALDLALANTEANLLSTVPLPLVMSTFRAKNLTFLRSIY